MTTHYVSTSKAAKILGVSVGTVQQMVENNKLEAWKTAGGHRRITVESIERILKQDTTVLTTPISTLLVYIVEDDILLLQAYALILENLGLPLEIHKFDNGLDAIFQIGVKFPDVLILDMELPYIDGTELLQRLHSRHDFSGQHIIILSGMSEQELAEKTAGYDNLCILQKPLCEKFIAGYLRALVQSHFQGRK